MTKKEIAHYVILFWFTRTRLCMISRRFHFSCARLSVEVILTLSDLLKQQSREKVVFYFFSFSNPLENIGDYDKTNNAVRYKKHQLRVDIYIGQIIINLG